MGAVPVIPATSNVTEIFELVVLPDIIAGTVGAADGGDPPAAAVAIPALTADATDPIELDAFDSK